MELHKKTQIEVQKLIDETGHTLTLSDIPDIIELNDLANKITGAGGDYAEMHSWPVKCGSLLFRPITIGKMAWYNQRASAWFADDPATLTLILAFLLSADNDESFIWGLETADSAKEKIDKWEKTIDVSPWQLSRCVDLMVKHEDDDGSGAGDGPLISLLCREYGNTPSHWLYKESVNVISALVSDYVRRVNSEIKASLKRRHGKPASMAPIKTPSMAASLKFKQKLESVADKWRSSNVG